MKMFHDNNRKRVIAELSGALVVLSAYDAMQESGDMTARFVQESNFWWLSGIEEPGWKVIIDGMNGGRATLVRPDVSEVYRIFDGTMSDESALEHSGAYAVITAKEFEKTLRQYARTHSVVRTIDSAETYDFVTNPAPRELVKTLKRIFNSTQDCSLDLAKLRAIKQPEEIRRMRRATQLTCRAFKDVREKLDGMKYEHEVEAEFTYRFRREAADHAYSPIVASGQNACTLHYIQNTAKLSARSPLLIDIGAKIEGYSADVTRTFCLNPTKRQRAVHQALVTAHEKIVGLLAPELLVSEYFNLVDEIMKDALQELGLLVGRDDADGYRKYFPHAISHGLGIDPHDSLGRPRYFQPGMVITVEPGIYITEEQIGMRIEDDILITASGHENLTGHLSTSL